MKTLKALSDRFLKLFLSEIPAGACVPENGQCCSAKHRRFNCYGSCIKTSVCG
ncbi:hypothetical protein [Corallococcus macrosporus]|uniref:Uncharacterized protein n=1 Tax=Myxococcus fulvus (strain ATCC BAA-855 / HW-1) TaxID=483219 RepID=F8C781_MYXFH|nr:hypothetical protein [Corallococcus macrosporus]AEI61957.1 hypothetical protein LILAB_00105 [Corallococcus macrosporus]